MESTVKQSLPSLIKTYYFLTKPGILFGNIITATAGFILASKRNLNFQLLFLTLLGLTLIMASGCVFNNYIDRKHDAKMKRTARRALVKGYLSVRNALIFGTALLFLGAFLLGYFVNSLSVILALGGFLVYVIFYSYSKHHTSYATLIGSFAGATPPVVGYCAVKNTFDIGALILFAAITLWQMPHFYAIAIYRFEEYMKASIPVLPIKSGMPRTKVYMALYIIAFIAAAVSLTLFNYTGLLFLIVMSLLGLVWLGISFKGFKCPVDKVWGRQMFLFSLVVIMGFSCLIPLSLH